MFQPLLYRTFTDWCPNSVTLPLSQRHSKQAVIKFYYVLLYKNRPSKMKFFRCQVFSWIWISKMSVKLNFRIIKKNQAAASKIGSEKLSLGVKTEYCLKLVWGMRSFINSMKVTKFHIRFYYVHDKQSDIIYHWKNSLNFKWRKIVIFKEISIL